MVEQVTADDKRVVVYASGADGGWAVLLTHGASRRELSGAERGAPRDRMSLLAAVSAVECLTRPTAVLVLTDNEYVRGGVAARTQGAVADERNADLWTRLGTAVKTHRVQWVVVDAALATRAAALAAAPASPANPSGAARNQAERPRPQAAPDVQRAPAARPSPERSTAPAEPRVLAAHPAPTGARASAVATEESTQPGRNAPKSSGPTAPPPAAPPAAAPPAAALPAATPDRPDAPAQPAGRRGLPPEIAAAMRPASTLGRPTGERTGLPFRAGDPVPAPPSADSTPARDTEPRDAGATGEGTPEADDETVEDTEGSEEFLDELKFWLEDEADLPPSGTVDEWLRDTPLRITELGEDLILFDAPDGRAVGPVPVPAGLAEQAEVGWQLRLTAARTGDSWHLRPTD